MKELTNSKKNEIREETITRVVAELRERQVECAKEDATNPAAGIERNAYNEMAASLLELAAETRY